MYPYDQIVTKIELVAQEYEKNGVIQAELIPQNLQRLVDIKRKKCSGIKRTKIGVKEKGENYVITTE